MSEITIQLAVVMIKLFDESPKVFHEVLVTGSVHRSIMLSIYRLLIRDNAITPIETLNAENKKILWERVHGIIDGRLAKEECIEMVKAIHALDIISAQ
jgi:hypothetical protein